MLQAENGKLDAQRRSELWNCDIIRKAQPPRNSYRIRTVESMSTLLCTTVLHDDMNGLKFIKLST